MIPQWDSIDALVRLTVLTDLQRERFVDVRLCGLTMDAVAIRDGISRQAVQMTIHKADLRLGLVDRTSVAA